MRDSLPRGAARHKRSVLTQVSRCFRAAGNSPRRQHEYCEGNAFASGAVQGEHADHGAVQSGSTDRAWPALVVRVLRVAHHAVVSSWRARERELRRLGHRVLLLSAKRWNEGGRRVDLDPESDRFVRAAGTLGSHPAVFLYNPLSIWRGLASGPDILDLHEEPFALATAEVLLLRALRRNRPPYVLDSAQNLDKRYPVPFRWFESWALRGAAGAYVCNSEAGRILVRKGLRGAAVLIPLGVDTAAFHPADRTAPQRAAIVGYVGRLEQHKGVDVLIHAVADLPSARLRLTGDGPERPRLEALAAELGIGDRVDFLGFASGEQLAQRYRSLDVLAVPSLPWPGWREQFCRVAVEAMASGIPVVASRTGAIPDVVADTGILVEPGDPAALADGLKRALDAQTWERLREAGLVRAREFTWTRVAEQHSAFYRRVAGARAAGAESRPEVIVVAYGSPDLLAGALEALGGELSVTIVDNSSSPETRALAAAHDAFYLDSGGNLGFGAGVNVGLRSLHARGLADRDVLLLNPDARISAEHVGRMHRALHSGDRIAAVGATQIDPATGEDVRVWWPFPSPARAWIDALGLGRFDRAHGFAIGSILMLRAEAVGSIGEFDEQFFLYAEEVDWQKRARDAGWDIEVVPVTASHIGGATSEDSSRRDAMFFASAERYQRKHFGALGWQVFRAGVILGAAVRVVTRRRQGRQHALQRLTRFIRGPLAAESHLRR